MKTSVNRSARSPAALAALPLLFFLGQPPTAAASPARPAVRNAPASPATPAVQTAPGPSPEIASDGPLQEPLSVVTTLPVYASIVEAIGGGEVEVQSIASPSEDAHFVRPRPSFALSIRRADVFVTTGLDLELWVPTLLDRAGNASVSEGGAGYVTTYPGITLLDVPATADRSGGDVHIYGNPHLHTDPLRTVQVARNITRGLIRVAPERTEHWSQGLARFIDRVHRSLFGDELVDLLGGPTLERLALAGDLFPFLESNDLEGTPLTDLLGGWLAEGSVFRDREMICYHKNWAYFEERFRVTCADYVEAKPGIPPTPRHVSRLVELMQNQGIDVLFAASYFDASKVESVAQRGGATAVIVPVYPGGAPGVGDYFSLVDRWVSDLAAAFGATEE